MTAPFASIVKIVNPDGTPTLEFLRWLSGLADTEQAASVDVAAASVLTLRGSNGRRAFRVTANRSTASAGIVVEDGAIIDAIDVVVASGVTDVDRFITIGSDCRIGEINVVAESQTDVGDTSLDGFVQIRGNNVSVGSIVLKNIDKGLLVYQADNVRIDRFDAESFQIAAHLSKSTNVTIGSFRTRTQSPNGAPTPGRDGLLIEDCSDCDFPFIDIADTPEHGIYIGGGSTGHSTNLTFGSITTRRTGQCGLKCKSNLVAQLHTGIKIGTLTVEDTAYGSSPGTNEDGLRIELTDGFSVGSINVSACYDGIFLNGVTNVSIGAGNIDHCANHMIEIVDVGIGGEVRDNGPISIAGLNGFTIGGSVVSVNHTASQQIRRLNIRATADVVTGAAVSVVGNTSFAPSDCLIDVIGNEVATSPAVVGHPDPNIKIWYREFGS